MQAYLTLTRRELAGFFFSITGYVIIAAAAFLVGLSFKGLINIIGNDPMPMPITEMFFSTWYFWIILALIIPVITMRLFAFEKSSGTFETLMTSPVSETQVVTAKFTAAMLVYLVVCVVLFGSVFVVQHFATGHARLDQKALECTFVGMVLFGCLYTSFGCFASSLTQNQVIAAIISIAFGFGVIFFSARVPSVVESEWLSNLLGLLAFPDQMQDYARGIVDTRSIVLCLTITFFFLFLTLRVIESRRWK